MPSLKRNKNTEVKDMRRTLSVLLVPLRVTILIVIIILKFIFELIPSLIYGISAWVLTPVGLLSGLFMRRPNPYKKALFTFKFSTAFLIIILPVILYLFIWKPLGLIFMFWMVVYFVIRLFSGAHEKEQMIREGIKGMSAITEKYKPFYIKNNLTISVIIILLSIIPLIIGYFVGAENGLLIGGIIAVCILVIGQYQYEVRLKDKDEKYPD